jgi:recombination protein RecT
MADEKDEKKVVKLPEPGKKKPVTIGDLLESKAGLNSMQMVVPQHVSAERLVKLCLVAVYKTPLLKECNAVTLLGAMMEAASLGLEPNTQMQHAYLIPFKNRKKGTYDVQLIIGYRGFIKLMWQSKVLLGLDAEVVYQGDSFSYERGSDRHLKHISRGGKAGREPLNAYAYVKFKDGGEEFEVMEYADVLKARSNSDGYRAAIQAKAEGKDYLYAKSPWVAHEHEMAVKTAIRRLVKFVPISADVSRAADIDMRSERGKVNFAAIAEDPERAKLGFDGGSEEDDGDEASNVEEGDDEAGGGQARKDVPPRDENLARSETPKTAEKAAKPAPKPQGRRSFFGDDA